MALHVNVGPYDPSGPLRIYWAGCLRISGNHLFFLRGPATTAGHGTVPGLIGKKPAPAFPKIRTAYRTKAKRKCYHCAIERSCERRLIFFICLISVIECFHMFSTAPSNPTDTNQILRRRRVKSGAQRRRPRRTAADPRRFPRRTGVVPSEQQRDRGSAAGARRREHSGIPGGRTAAAARQCPRGGFPG